eukprot:Nk52_evm56s221 gene=Nk52_evmTU56s221
MKYQSLSTLPIKPSVLRKLVSKGYNCTEDIIHLNALQLSRSVGVTNGDAVDVLKVIRHYNVSIDAEGPSVHLNSVSARHLLQEEQSQPGISLMCSEIDSAMGGKGIPLGQLSEFCGAPGIGKTQIAIQAAVNVQIPVELGGAEGKAIYIDTEGSFIIDRVVEIAHATEREAQSIGAELIHQSKGAASEESIEQLQSKLAKFNVEHILSNILYFRVHDYVEQISVTRVLDEIVNEVPDVKVIIIDSVAFHFRHDVENFSLRNRLLNITSQTLMKLAKEYNLAVVIVNQMTTKIRSGNSAIWSSLVPALGESWGHCCTNRFLLRWVDGVRQMSLFKSANRERAVANYCVTQSGIRSCEPNV